LNIRYKTTPSFSTGITFFISNDVFANPAFSEKTFRATWLAVFKGTSLADKVNEKRREEKRREKIF
jgi:hypothetical protein